MNCAKRYSSLLVDMSNFTKAAVSLIMKNTNLLRWHPDVFCIASQYNEFPLYMQYFYSINIYLCPIYFKIQVSSNLSIEDLSTRHMTYVVLSACMPGASAVVAPGDDGFCVSNQHPSI